MNHFFAVDSAEAGVLFAAARREQLRVPEGVDWASLLAAAEVEGMLGLLATKVEHAEVARDRLRELQVRHLLLVGRSMLMSRELERVVREFEQESVPILSYKGSVLSQQLYGDPAARSFGDLDVVVGRDDADKGEEILRRLGYGSGEPLRTGQLRTHRRFNNETVFSNPDKRIAVDFHWGFATGHFPFGLRFQEAWERRVYVEVDGFPVPTLSAVDLVLTTVNHAAKHLWWRLEFLAQLHALAVAPDVDWQEVERAAFRLHVSRQLGLSYLLTERILGTKLPPIERACESARPSINPVARIVEANLFARSVRHVDASGRDLLHLLDRRRDAARSVAMAIFAPTWTDWRTASMPAPLYWFSRPVRLVWKGITEKLRSKD